MGEARADLVRRAYEAFASRDVEALRALADPEVEIITVTGMIAGREEPYRGYEGIAAYIADVASVWDRIELTPSEFHELDEGRLLVFGRVRARRGSYMLDLPNAWLWEFRGERILRARVFADPQGAELFLEREDR